MLTLIAALALSMTAADDTLRVTATMPDAIPRAGSFKVQIHMDLADAWTAGDAGLPGFVIQLATPDGVTPAGNVLTDQRELAKNEYLQAPYERLVEGTDADIEFNVDGEPAGPVAINVIAFLTRDQEVTFVRRRIELPVEAGATGQTADPATRSDWGTDAAGLQIGDKAPDFTLPRADGSTVTLSDELAQSNVIVTTYRAFW